jgi:hypothetical protein
VRGSVNTSMLVYLQAVSRPLNLNGITQAEHPLGIWSPADAVNTASMSVHTGARNIIVYVPAATGANMAYTGLAPERDRFRVCPSCTSCRNNGDMEGDGLVLGDMVAVCVAGMDGVPAAVTLCEGVIEDVTLMDGVMEPDTLAEPPT